MTSKPVNKIMEPSKADLIRALCALEGELQAKDIVISILKTEQVRRLIHPCYNKRWWTQPQPHSKLSTDTIIPNNRALKCKQLQLQQHIQHQDSTTTTTNSQQNQQQSKQLQQQTNKSIQIDPSDPYTALLRDTYCAYDPTYDENSIKLIYNLQYQNLRNLIDHQRKVRNYLESQICEREAKYKACLEELESEKTKSAKYERDKMISQIELLEKEKESLGEQLEIIKSDLEKVKEREKSMVMCLVTERKELICRLIEHEQHNNALIDMLTAERCRAAEMSEDLEEESKRSLQMESELERLTASHELSKSLLLDKINNLENKSTKLEEENDKLKKELETIKSKRIAQLGEGVRSTIVTVNSTDQKILTHQEPGKVVIASGSPQAPIQKKFSTGPVTGTGSSTSPLFRGTPPPIPPNKPILPANALKERSKEIQQATLRAKMITTTSTNNTTNTLSTSSSTPVPVQGERNEKS
ncbi:CTTNBP2 N-terminal-like protein [Panonychus citri]|uniref:CTTNBP2 N-terminal-like protein n=1 Tax=Panonychus citri TaxID=50023 RepID=UPI00230811FF|nr:CTTNBP2 N-terminal-like protein [Panonychus citri]